MKLVSTQTRTLRQRLEWPITILTALLIAVVLKTFIVAPFWIPSESMTPTLLVDDRLFVSKINPADVTRDDIVVFESPFDDSRDDETTGAFLQRIILESIGIRPASTEDFIKRVVATEGQVVEIRDGNVWVDDVQLIEPYLQDGTTNGNDTIVVGPGQVFVMGDNRLNSSDSRRFGTISTDDIIGKALLRYWPIDRFGSLD